MTEYTSIRVTADAKENAEASKRDGETWNEYLQRCTDNPPEVREYVDADDLQEAFGLPDEAFPDDFTLEINDDLRGSVPDDLQEQLDRIESAASTVEERTGSIENTLENAGLGR